MRACKSLSDMKWGEYPAIIFKRTGRLSLSVKAKVLAGIAAVTDDQAIVADALEDALEAPAQPEEAAATLALAIALIEEDIERSAGAVKDRAKSIKAQAATEVNVEMSFFSSRIKVDGILDDEIGCLLLGVALKLGLSDVDQVKASKIALHFLGGLTGIDRVKVRASTVVPWIDKPEFINVSNAHLNGHPKVRPR